MPCQTALKKNDIIFSSWPLSSLFLKETFFSPSRRVFNFLRFCPVYVTVTSSPSVLDWAWRNRKVSLRISGGFDLVSWTKLFFHVLEMYKINSFSIFFQRRLVNSSKKGFLLLKVFVNFSNAFRLKLRLLQGRLKRTLNNKCDTYVSLRMTSNGSEL